jgi:hypothetical protein
MSSAVLDAGALIAIERGTERAQWLVRAAVARDERRFVVPTGVVAQVWRGGPRQARLAQFLRLPAVEQVGLSAAEARAVGRLLADSGTDDIVDAWVVLCARLRFGRIVTSDPDDLRRLDPTAELVVL